MITRMIHLQVSPRTGRSEFKEALKLELEKYLGERLKRDADDGYAEAD